MSIVSQRFSRTSNAGGAPARENNVVSLGDAIGARGLPPGPDLRPCKSLTCSDAMRIGPNGRHRGLLRLTECSHHVGSSGLVSEEQLDSLADYVEEMAIAVPDPAIETSIVLRALLGPDRVARIRLAVAEEVPSQFSSMLDDWRSNYDRNIEPGDYLSPLREAVTAYGLTDLSDQIVELEQSLEETYGEYLEQYEEQDEDRSDDARISQAISERSIFDDVDA
jgi:hypothetical protein